MYPSDSVQVYFFLMQRLMEAGLYPVIEGTQILPSWGIPMSLGGF